MKMYDLSMHEITQWHLNNNETKGEARKNGNKLRQNFEIPLSV